MIDHYLYHAHLNPFLGVIVIFVLFVEWPELPASLCQITSIQNFEMQKLIFLTYLKDCREELILINRKYFA